MGYDLNGNVGQPLFSDTSGAGAASNLKVAITDPSLIAASSDGTQGSNGNVANLLAVQNQALPGGEDSTGRLLQPGISNRKPD
jgi:flagellar hook-associated protein 1